jgi:hypothetical protein
MARPARLNLKVRQARAGKNTATEQIDKLLRGLKAGTLDRKKLESGLRKIRSRIRLLPDHYKA